MTISFFYSQGLRRIMMGAKLNEVAARYSQEGWDSFYLAVASSDCQIILDMFSELFGPLAQLDLEEPAQKKAHTEAAAVEEEMLKQEGLPNTSKETILFLTSLPILTEFGLEKEFQPTINYLVEPSRASGQKITKTYYSCTICSKHSQNKDSMYTHARWHLNILL